MIDSEYVSRYGALPSAPEADSWRDTRTYPQDPEFTPDDFSSLPTCTNHHTYVNTIPVQEHRIWVCPSCGSFSDHAYEYTGGYGLCKPQHINPDEFVYIDGQSLIRPDDWTNADAGDDAHHAALITSPYEAKEDIKTFDRWRRWVSTCSAWAVRWSDVEAFEDHMESHSWPTLNYLHIRETATDRNAH